MEKKNKKKGKNFHKERFPDANHENDIQQKIIDIQYNLVVPWGCYLINKCYDFFAIDIRCYVIWCSLRSYWTLQIFVYNIGWSKDLDTLFESDEQHLTCLVRGNHS